MARKHASESKQTDEQMLGLEKLAETLEHENLEPTQNLERHASKGNRTARPKVGLPVPHEAMPSRFIPLSKKAAVFLGKALNSVDSRMVEMLTASSLGNDAFLELLILQHLRNCLQRQVGDLPTDAVLCDTMVEFVDYAQRIVNDLQAAEPTRFHCMTGYLREMLSELLVLEIKESTDLKVRLQQLRDLSTPETQDWQGLMQVAKNINMLFLKYWPTDKLSLLQRIMADIAPA